MLTLIEMQHGLGLDMWNVTPADISTVLYVSTFVVFSTKPNNAIYSISGGEKYFTPLPFLS